MVETIESFVAKLQAEGVEAGQQAGEQLRTEAGRQAEQIIQDAEKQAQDILANAKTASDNLLARGRTDLELAARDVILRLQSALQRTLEAIMGESIADELPKADFLSKTLHDLVLMYARADIEHKGTMKINVSPELHSQLADWALKEMTNHARQAGMTIDLKGTLDAAGFEYNVTGATVEVTKDAVTELLSDLVSPRLRKLLTKAAGDFVDQPPQAAGQDSAGSSW